MPAQEIHGRSIAPQLLGNPGQLREWIHIQNANDRQLRSGEYMLNNKGQLRQVVGMGEPDAKEIKGNDSDAEAFARKNLQAVFDQLSEKR